MTFLILGVVKRNPLFLHEIEWKNNGFLFTTPNTIFLMIIDLKLLIQFFVLQTKQMISD